MILKWRNLWCGTFIRNIVGLFVALILWGTHVQGRRTDNRAVISRHTPYFSSKTDLFGVSANSPHQWVNFVNPAISGGKRHEEDTDSTSANQKTQPIQIVESEIQNADSIEIRTNQELNSSRKSDVKSEENYVSDSSSGTTHNQNASVEHSMINVEKANTFRDNSSHKSDDNVKLVSETEHNSRLDLNKTSNGSSERNVVARNGTVTSPTDVSSFDTSFLQAGNTEELNSIRQSNRAKSNVIQILPSSDVLDSNSQIIGQTENDVITKNLRALRAHEIRSNILANADVKTEKTVISSNGKRLSNHITEATIKKVDFIEVITPTPSEFLVNLENKIQHYPVTDSFTVDFLQTVDDNYDRDVIESGVTDTAVSLAATSSGGGSRTSILSVDSLFLMRLERQATAAQEEGAEMIAACRRFVEGNPEKGEFYSPYFPNNYPNNTDCIKVLAASPGHLLRLDFRDEFYIEPSEGCRFDFLEVRDGAHGYENLIGTFCGREFPPMMTSSGRYLWLRFHSDENIEYKGFSAVYESIPRPSDGDHLDMPECVIDVGGMEGHISTGDIDAERRRIAAHFSLTLECMWIIRVKPGWRIQLSFVKFELAKPNDCVSNFVDVFSDRTDLTSRLKSFCGSIADMVTSKSHILHVRFLAESKAINSTFEALYTAFRDSKLSACTKDEFDCQDETCISGELRCNGRINCRFRWDEDECKTKRSQLEIILSSDHIIIILVVFSLIMFGMCFAFVFNCVRKLMHDHKIIQENFRQSREGRLDEVGVKLPASPRGISVVPHSISSSHDNVHLHHRSLHHLHNNHVDVETRMSSEEPVMPGQECYVPGAGDLMPILIGATRTTIPDTNNANGDAVFLRDNSNSDDENVDDLEMSNFPIPEMRDNECQTRESLFMNTNSDRSITPPPPPPPVTRGHNQHHHHHHHQNNNNNNRPVGQFSTFGYNRDNRRDNGVGTGGPPPFDYSTMPHNQNAAPRKPRDDDPRLPKEYTHHRPYPPHLPESQRFRAEAVIEMESGGGGGVGGGGGGGGDDKRPFSVDSTKSAPDVIVTH